MRRRVPATLAALALAVTLRPAATQDEVPFVVTPDHVTVAMLELAQVGPKDFVLDLGSGDGRIVIAAARRFGARGLGVEIVPELVERSRHNAERAGVPERARFVEQDLFATDLTQATVITMYLLPEVNLQLRPKLLALAPGTRVVSHDWDMGDWPADRTRVVEAPDKPVGRDKASRLYLWVVPARIDGAWCAAGGAKLEVAQRYQTAQGTLQQGSRRIDYSGRVEAAVLRADTLTARLEGAKLVVSAGGGTGDFERCPR